MAVKRILFIFTVFAIVILGLAIYPVLANDAAEEKAATVEKAAGETTEKVAEETVEAAEEAAAEEMVVPAEEVAESVH